MSGAPAERVPEYVHGRGAEGTGHIRPEDT
jgi:hypothetical protein